MSSKIKTAILGASGYTGAELVRLLSRHGQVDLAVLTADRRAGKSYGEVFPHLGGLGLPDLVAMGDVDFSSVDAVFCALPHGTTQTVIADLFAKHDHLKVIDLSADFRLEDEAEYAKWYGHAHQAAHLQGEAVYGLTEINRKAIRAARLVACPGCYPTSAQLPLVPLLKSGLIQAQDIIIDAKSGVTGAGRAPKEGTLYAEVAEGVHAYGIAAHRHAPEIDQGLSQAAEQDVMVNFTPHLMPMSRGILSTIYVKLAGDATVEDLRQTLDNWYAAEPFVRVLGEGEVPHTRHVRGSNMCLMNAFDDRLPGRAILCSVIDNVVKGASGQAIQNFNVMFDLPETTSLEQQPLFP